MIKRLTKNASRCQLSNNWRFDLRPHFPRKPPSPTYTFVSVSFRPRFGLKISGLGPSPGSAIDFTHNSVTPNIKRNWPHFFSTLTTLSTLPVAINWDYCNAGFTGPGNCFIHMESQFNFKDVDYQSRKQITRHPSSTINIYLKPLR